MKDGFIRAAAATPAIKVGDCVFNRKQMEAMAFQAAKEDASLIAFPELSLTAYTCGDLFLHKKLLDSAEQELLMLAQNTAALDILIITGLPVRDGAALYNCAALLYHGEILGLVPKTNIPNYSEFYEQRHFSGGPAYKTVMLGGKEIPLGTRLLFAGSTVPELRLGIEICEDLWVPVSPSCALAAAGANLIVNISASDELIGKADFRRSLVKAQSAKLIAAYLYSDAGEGESTTDLVFAGHNLIAENGTLLAESARFSANIIYGDIDLQRMDSERRRTTTFPKFSEEMHMISFALPVKTLALRRKIAPKPFVPADAGDLAERCMEILTLQATGLATRLRHTGSKTAVVGLSGGLDSTLALVVVVHAFDLLGKDRKDILAVTMPGFGTTGRTKSNASVLAQTYGATLREISIARAVEQHFVDIGQNPDTHDVTYENAQARERTQILMDIANQTGGLVIGTGDLSEMALGWATYNGDHMSMYGVNASVPKTLVRHLVAFEAARSGETLQRVLLDVLDTPVSPELLPPENGEIAQKTEDIVGPYELHDFFLYYFLRFGFTPSKIFRLAKHALGDIYSDEAIKKWLVIFLRRFFTHQFKRSCLPDGPKVGTVTLSPRGDLRMPSDASAAAWLAEAESIQAE